MVYILIVGNIILSVAIGFILVKEQKRSKILQSFIFGIIRAISDYKNILTDDENAPEQNIKLPIPYKKLLKTIEYGIVKDFENSSRKTGGVEDFIKWSNLSKDLFLEKNKAVTNFANTNYGLFNGLKEEIEKDLKASTYSSDTTM